MRKAYLWRMLLAVSLPLALASCSDSSDSTGPSSDPDRPFLRADFSGGVTGTFEVSGTSDSSDGFATASWIESGNEPVLRLIAETEDYDVWEDEGRRFEIWFYNLKEGSVEVALDCRADGLGSSPCAEVWYEEDGRDYDLEEGAFEITTLSDDRAVGTFEGKGTRAIFFDRGDEFQIRNGRFDVDITN